MQEALMTRSSVHAQRVLLHALLGFAWIFAVGIAKSAEQPKEADESAKLLAEQVCASCHGPRGLSTLEDIPILASQKDVYIAAKLWQFRNQSLRRPEQHLDLLGIALLDDATVESLARYFASQPAPPSVARDVAAVEAGGAIFSRGIANKGVAACAVCHGVNAQGFGIVPRLAGQHARYVERQLRVIQLQLRKTRVMHGIVNDLSLDEIQAVAAFVQSK
jgi:cytochrome c553